MGQLPHEWGVFTLTCTDVDAKRLGFVEIAWNVSCEVFSFELVCGTKEACA